MMKNEKDMLTIRIQCDGPIKGLTVTADVNGNVKGFVEELKDNNLHWKGSANQNVIDVKKSLRTGEIVIYG